MAAAVERLVAAPGGSAEPLVAAAALGRLDAVAELVAEGARLEVRGPGGRTALMAAAEGGHPAVVALLAGRGAAVSAATPRTGQSGLWRAALRGRLAALETLLALGAAVDQQDIAGDSPLAVACQEGHTACVLALLRAGADPALRAGDGATPLHMAAQRNRRPAVAALLEHGCDPHIVRHLVLHNTGRAIELCLAAWPGREDPSAGRGHCRQ
jgi:ankyrin repeat protein